MSHPQTRFISFTELREVGLHIVEEAGKTRDGQKWVKRVAADEVRTPYSSTARRTSTRRWRRRRPPRSASRAKCSACSRAIVDAKVYDQFVDKLKTWVAKIVVGDVKNPSSYMGAVSSERAFKTI